MERLFCTALAGALVVFSTSGCALMINGTSQEIPVVTVPANATIRVEGGIVQKVPSENDGQGKRRRHSRHSRHSRHRTIMVPNATFVAPTTITLSRRKTHQITAEKPGYEPMTANVTREFDAQMAVIECLVWLCVPLIFEIPAGAVHELKPSQVVIVLPEKPREANDEPTPAP